MSARRSPGNAAGLLDRLLRGLLALLLVATVQVWGAGALSAQAYGLDTRPSTPSFLSMPDQLPVPSGSFIPQLAFGNLTFQNPVALTYAPGTNLLFVCEREGRIYSFHNDPGTSTKTLVLDLSHVTQGWGDCGLLGMALHPEFGVEGSPNRGYFYALYHYRENPVPGPIRPPPETPAFNRLSRFTIPDLSFVADPASELVLINQHDRHVWHNGSAMFFHPDDGFLYFTIGDEGDGDDSYDSVQKIDDKLFGGVFRIDVDMRGGGISHPIRRQPQSYPGRPSYTQDYYIPDDNPWLDPGGSVLEEFWAHGLRSPHRMTYDATSDMILLGDVGQAAWEEISIIEKGGNYQWPYKEGFHDAARPKPATLIGVEKPPIYEYMHGPSYPFHGNCVVGGYIYRGTKHPDLLGKYLFGDNTYGRLWALDPSTNPIQVAWLCNMPSGSGYTGLSSFGIDANNELYMTKMGHTGPGYIYELGRSSASGAPVPALLSQTGAFSDVANLVPSSGLIPYDVGSPLRSDGAIKTRWMSVPDGQVVLFNEHGEWVFPPGTVFVKHFELVVDEVTLARKRLETRLLVQKANGSVYGVTYKWRNDGNDADLLMNGLNEDITIKTPTGSRVQTYSYPSSQECLTCHNAAANHVLGVKTRQLNNDMVYPGTAVQDNQLRALNHIGMFDQVLNEADIPDFDSLADLDDTGASLEHRVRSYIDSNCSQCHRPGHVQGFFDARFDTPLEEQGLIDGAVGNDLGIAGAAVIRPRDLDRSILRVRDSSLSSAIKMPPLGKNTVDNAWLALLDQYIQSLLGIPVLDSPTIMPADGTYDDEVQVSIAHTEPTAGIHYTTDGSDPDTGSTLYAGPFNLTSSATVKAMASAPGFADSVATQADYTVTTFRDPDNPPDVSQGLRYEQYLGTFDFLPEFDGVTPEEAGTRSNFSISPRLQNDQFAFRFNGYIDVPTTDVYTFYTTSDDGSQLFIGTDLVVDNDGRHEATERSGEIALQAGLHAITVTYFENTGDQVLDVGFGSSTAPKTAVPYSALFHIDTMATVFLNDLTVVYDSNPVAMNGTTVPPALPLTFTYDGDPTPPTDAGTYAAVATVDDPVYQGSATATLTIEQSLATVSISDTAHLYDGSGKSATVTTNPPLLIVSTTYDGSPPLPIDAGAYTVDVDVIDQNHTGSGSATLVIDPAPASIALGDLTQSYDGTPRIVSATTTPEGIEVEVTYDGSTTPPTDIGIYAVGATIADPNHTGSGVAGTLVVEPGSASISLGDLVQTFDGDPRPVTVTTTPPGLAATVTYDDLGSAPTEVGSYAVDAVIDDPNYTGSETATLTIDPGQATVILGDLTQPYDGTPRVVSATTTPPGVEVEVTYDGSTTPPTDIGSYPVNTTVVDPNYTGSAADTLVVETGSAGITLADLVQTFDGTPRPVTVTTTPPGLAVIVTYDDLSAAPTDPGSYTVEAEIDAPNYTGSQTAALTIDPAPATVTLGDLTQPYDGTPRVVPAWTIPTGLAVEVTYDSSTTPPTDLGSYAVIATITDPNHTGSTADTLVVEPDSANIVLSDLVRTFDGTPRPVTVTTTPPGLAVTVTYDSLDDAPTDAGSYTVEAAIDDPDFTGSETAVLTINPAAATVTLSGLNQVYDGTERAVGVTTVPAGLTVDVTYDGSTTPPTGAGSYAVVATVNEPNHSGAASDTLTVPQAAATITLENLAQTFDGTPRAVGISTEPDGLAVALTYDGLAPAPTDAGSYTVEATIADPNHTGYETAILTVDPAAASITLGDLTQPYDGTPRVASATTTPAGLAVQVTYDGLGSAPTDAGSYTVEATIADPNHTGYETATLTVDPVPASIVLGNLTQPYNGTPRLVFATTTPDGIAVQVTYDGSTTPPTDIGSYAVTATISDPNYTGSIAADTLMVQPGPVSISLLDLVQTFDGTPRPVTVTTMPPGMAVTVTYDSLSAAPTDIGSYTVEAVIDDPNYTGSKTATLIIDPAHTSVFLGNLSQIYDGTECVVGVTTVPAGVAIDLTYDGSTTPPTGPGSYAVVATVNDPNHSGAASGTLTVAQAAAVITLDDLTQTFDGTPRPVNATTAPPGLAVTVTYDGLSSAPTDAGSYTVEAMIDDPNYTGSEAATLSVHPAATTVTLGGLTQPYDGTPRVVSATTTPDGVAIQVTYAGSTTPPTDVGSYAVTAAITDPNHTGSVAATLVVQSGLARVTLSDLEHVFDGTPHPVTATTTPPGMAVTLTYDGLGAAPTDAGSYTVEAVIDDINYSGSGTATLTIDPAPASVVMGGLIQPYDGTPRVVSVTTVPADIAFELTYHGTATPPTEIGSYAVSAVITDPNYTGSVTNSLVVYPGSASIVLGNLVQTFDGAPHPATVTTTPPGLEVTVTYDGLSSAPTDAGSYTVKATIADPGYTGSETATLTVHPAPASITLQHLMQPFDNTPRVVAAATNPPGLPVDILYDGSPTPPTAQGNYAIEATIVDANYTGSANGVLNVEGISRILAPWVKTFRVIQRAIRGG